MQLHQRLILNLVRHRYRIRRHHHLSFVDTLFDFIRFCILLIIKLLYASLLSSVCLIDWFPPREYLGILTNILHCRALFTTTLHSREQSDVLISGVRSEILLLLIEYAYLRRIDVTDTNVHELLMTADYLAFLGVLQLCCDHLRLALNPKNCLGIMMFAR